MKASPFFSGFDTESNNYEYDLQTDFGQFLEEAKKPANGKEILEEQIVKSQQQQQEKHVNVGEKINKKSWKTALYSLVKSSKKKKECSSKVQVSFGSHGLKQRSYFSGPVHSHQVSGMGPNADRLASSGPLAGLFQGKKKEEMNDIAYVSLDMVNKPPYGIYGPIYLVS